MTSFKQQLKQYVAESGLVNMKPAGDGIFVLKYKKKVFYDNLWNDYIAECRGTIVDADFNLVSYPLVDAIRANIDEYTAMDEQARLNWVRKFLGTN